MKKILFMAYSMHLGGVEKALSDLINVLAKDSNWDITLLLLRKEGEFIDRLPKNIKIQECILPESILMEAVTNTSDALFSSLKKLHMITFSRIALDFLYNRKKNPQEVLKRNYKRWIKKIKPNNLFYDVAIDFQGTGVFTTFYIAYCVNAKKKVSWIHNDISIIEEDMSWQKSLYAKYDKVFCVSQAAREKTLEKLPFLKGKDDVFYNIIPEEKIQQASREKCDKLNGKIKIMTIGRLTPQKGYDIALEVINNLKKQGYVFEYYIIGDGEIRKEIEQQISLLALEDTVHILGYQENPYKYLCQCDIYFQPSRYEGFCITLGEAKLFNKPIVTTDFAGAREQIEDGVTGIIIPCDKKEMILALKTLFDNAGLRMMLSSNLMQRNTHPIDDTYKLKQLLDK